MRGVFISVALLRGDGYVGVVGYVLLGRQVALTMPNPGNRTPLRRQQISQTPVCTSSRRDLNRMVRTPSPLGGCYAGSGEISLPTSSSGRSHSSELQKNGSGV